MRSYWTDAQTLPSQLVIVRGLGTCGRQRGLDSIGLPDFCPSSASEALSLPDDLFPWSCAAIEATSKVIDRGKFEPDAARVHQCTSILMQRPQYT